MLSCPGGKCIRLFLCILCMHHAEVYSNAPIHLDKQTMADTMALLQCRQALASNLRRQIQALREQDGSDKSAMPSYGTVVRYIRTLPAGCSICTILCIVAYLMVSYQQRHSNQAVVVSCAKAECTDIMCSVLTAPQHAGQSVQSCC